MDAETAGMAHEATPGSLRGVSLLGSLDGAALGRLAARCTWRRYEAGDVVFSESMAPDGLSFVVSGKLRLCEAGEDAAIAMHDVERGGHYGLRAAFGGSALQNVTALEASEIAILNAGDLEDLLVEKPDIAIALIKELARDRVSAGTSAGPEAGLSEPERIWRELLDLSEADPAKPGQRIIARMPKHRELAERCGSSEAVVAGLIADLIRKGQVKRAYPGLKIIEASDFASQASAL